MLAVILQIFSLTIKATKTVPKSRLAYQSPGEGVLDDGIPHDQFNTVLSRLEPELLGTGADILRTQYKIHLPQCSSQCSICSSSDNHTFATLTNSHDRTPTPEVVPSFSYSKKTKLFYISALTPLHLSDSDSDTIGE